MTCCGIELGAAEWCPVCGKDLRTPAPLPPPERPTTALQRFLKFWNRMRVRPAVVEANEERGVGIEIRREL